MSTNVFRLVLATGATYKDAKILTEEELENAGLPLFFDSNEQVAFVGDGQYIFAHKAGLDTFQLNQDHPQPGQLGEVIQFAKAVLSGGKVYGPGYMCLVEGNSLEDAGIPEFPFFDKPVAIVTSEGTFLSDATKIHSVILAKDPAVMQAVRGYTAATVGVRSGRNVPNQYQAVLERMKEGTQEAEAGRRQQGQTLMAGQPADHDGAQATAQSGHYFGTGRTISGITTQADLDPLAAKDAENRGDRDAEVIKELDAREEARQTALDSGELAGNGIPVANDEMVRRGAAVHNPPAPNTRPTPTSYPENSGATDPGETHLVSKSQGGAVSAMGVSENDARPVSTDQLARHHANQRRTPPEEERQENEHDRAAPTQPFQPPNSGNVDNVDNVDEEQRHASVLEEEAARHRKQAK